MSPVVFTLFRCLYCHGSNTTEGKLTTRLRISLANFLKFTLLQENIIFWEFLNLCFFFSKINGEVILMEDMAYPKHIIVCFGMINDFVVYNKPKAQKYGSIVMVWLLGVSLHTWFIYIVYRAMSHASQM